MRSLCLLVVAAVVVAGCAGNADSSPASSAAGNPGEPERSVSTAAAADNATATTITGEERDDALAFIQALGRLHVDEGWRFFAGRVVEAGPRSLDVEFDRDLLGVADIKRGDFVQVAVDDPGSAFEAFRSGDAPTPYPSVVGVNSSGAMVGAGIWVLDESLDRFWRGGAGESPVAGGYGFGDWLDDGLMVFPGVVPAVDPSRSVWCQDLRPREVVVKPGPGEVDRTFAAAREAAISERVAAERVELVRSADLLAEQTVFSDPVTGRTTSASSADTVDQVLRAGSLEGVAVRRTVPLVVDATGWDASGTALAFVDETSGRSLGWVELTSDDGASVIEVVAPDQGSSLAVFLSESGDPSCTEDLGELIVSVPFASIAGDSRAWVSLAEATFEDWDGTEPG